MQDSLNGHEQSDFSLRNLDLFQFVVLNPQIAMLSFLQVGQKLASQPEKIEKSQRDLLRRLLELQKSFTKQLCQAEDQTVDLKYNKDREKFEANAFENNPMMLFARQFYETTSGWLMDLINDVDDVDQKLRHSAGFFMKQYIDMMSPDNFPFLNPTVLRETLDTCGENLKNGFEMFMNDMKNGFITTNDRDKFEIGKNIAATPGKVIYQNEIIELIQYSPTTDQVFAKPILLVPPWINKFYILDLKPESSFVKWAVDMGFTVFMISWVNPDKRYRDMGFDDYARRGLLESINAISRVTKAKRIHALGYCVGGTLISGFLAYLAHPRCKIQPEAEIESATLLTTLLDFEHAGDMAIFMAENYLEAINSQLKEKGILEGHIMYNTFSALRAKDMVWRYFINSYMLGRKPGAHDILFWNSDPTNLTQSMQIFLANDLYRDNLLKTGLLKMFDVPIDLKLIRTPLYMISMRKDHLVPWQATYDGMKLFNTRVKFVLGGSGHVVGAINPPSRNKYSYWINDRNLETAQEWLNAATEIAGSWWNNWFEWIRPMMGELLSPPPLKDFIRNAPGIYVHNKLPDDFG
ncbi:MAG: alpha/beta fold hydrolase [Holosporaceae bacterium]|jgi:polyhydroxyalkanoate synthase|nr:alpha/beta fold hydrolase [Holosporaceae bacterium]